MRSDVADLVWGRLFWLPAVTRTHRPPTLGHQRHRQRGKPRVQRHGHKPGTSVRVCARADAANVAHRGPAQGAGEIVRLAVDPALDGVTGRYFSIGKQGPIEPVA